MVSPYAALRPLLFRTSPETAHRGAIALGKVGQLAPFALRAMYRHGLSAERVARLRVEAFGVSFPNPLGLAAGVDKNAELVPLWSAISLGFCEVGSVSARPSPGNPRPRAFRLPADRALVNRMGLNNDGAEVIAKRIAGTRRPSNFPLGINIVKTHDPTILGDAGLEDFAASARALLPHADFVVLNVSCPNTAEGKTFESPEALAPLLDAVFVERARQALATPILVKFSPPPAVDFDTGAVDELVDLSIERGVAGFVATNTASDRAGLATPAAELDAIGAGGLSGAPIAARAEALCRHLFRRADGRATVVGVGGIDSPEAAYSRIRAGAHLVEMYTGLVYEGPGLVARTLRFLDRALERDGFGSIAEAVGVDVS
ncbi:MAG: quinone-dependent dihydroorotate dehydrogenase [Planctomycetota bacterium]